MRTIFVSDRDALVEVNVILRYQVLKIEPAYNLYVYCLLRKYKKKR